MFLILLLIEKYGLRLTGYCPSTEKIFDRKTPAFDWGKEHKKPSTNLYDLS
jgi:hypothetical protein